MASQTIMLLLTEEQSKVMDLALKEYSDNTETPTYGEVADELRLEILKKRRQQRNG